MIQQRLPDCRCRFEIRLIVQGALKRGEIAEDLGVGMLSVGVRDVGFVTIPLFPAISMG